MKKFALVLAVGLLAACGGSGGGGTNAGSNTSTGITPTMNGATGLLSVNIQSSSPKQLAFSLNSTVSTAVPTTTTMRRIVVTNPALKNSAGKIVQFTYTDHDATTFPAIVIPNIPVGDGYTIDVIEFERTKTGNSAYYQPTVTRFPARPYPNWSTSYTYVPAGPPTTDVAPIKITKYVAKTFNMPAAGTQSVSLAPLALTGITTISRGDTRYNGAIPSNSNVLFSVLSTQYKMKATFSTLSSAHVLLTPFRDTWTLKQSYATDLSGATSTQVAGAITQELTGPSAYNTINAYQNSYTSAGVFYLKDTLVYSGESATDFQFTTDKVTLGLHTRRGSLGTPVTP